MEVGKSVEYWAEQIRDDIGSHRVFVYAKGEKGAAACGYSGQVMKILDHLGVEYEVRNIFSDPNIRPAVCAFTEWPTIPQIFVDGKFVGGCDILTEMYQSGELQRALGLEAGPVS